MNGVIETATGDLLRKGSGVDFANDGAFDATKESVRADVPDEAILRGRANPFSRWDGSAWILFEDLSLLKMAKQGEIDLNTQRLIRQGFTHAGKVFSLSTNAQIYISNLMNVPPTEFPVQMNTLDDLATHSIVDVLEAQALYGAALGTVKARLGSGTSLKEQVRAATTKAQVDAIIDTR